MRILVVEDEIRLSAYLKRGLEAEGFAVDIAQTGTDGLWLATEQPYDALVLDIMLPGPNGYEICKELRAAGNWVPILMLTAKSGEHDVAQALDIGADDFLSKPFSFVVLLARLRALLRRGSPARPAVICAGTLSMDPSSREVRRGDTRIELTPREYSLLEYLLRHAGSVLSKTEIMAHVWDWEFDGAPNVVEVYVGYVRRKIDTPFGLETLRTVRGAGYVLVPDE